MCCFPENVDRFSGFAARYDECRPAPPAAFADVLTRYAKVDRPALVVDLGCGTGLSTRLWAGRADRVVGIEPNDEMRAVARSRTDAPEITYRAGHGAETGQADAGADIVTVSQALHWMEPRSTLAEAARILRPGGVFAAIDCDWPPTIAPEVDTAYRVRMRQAREYAEARGWVDFRNAWHKHEHLARIQASGHFRHARELLLHGVETGSVERLIGLATTETSVAVALSHGVSERELGLVQLGETARRIMGADEQLWYVSFRVRVGVV
jgi:SAM-dependent methyltransferase